MKKIYCTALYLLILLLTNTAQLPAQPYELTFGMKGKNNTPDSVYVENLQKGTSLMLMGGDVLLLTIPTISTELKAGDADLMIYPNPVNDRATIRFYNPQNGLVTLKLVDITGRQVAIQKEKLPQGEILYLVSGILPGTFILHVSTLSQTYSKALISTGAGKSNPCLSLQSTHSASYKAGASNNQIKSGKNITDIKPMEYSTGDVLTFKAYLTGAETKTDTLIPGSDIKHEFDIFYYTLTDYDLNTYLAVVIGNQVWMAENLKVIHYPDGNPIHEAKEDGAWEHVADKGAEAVYCYYDNDKYSEYGALYSWPAALGNKGVYSKTNPSGVQGVCPAGWHLPSMEEWKELRDFIAQDGYSSRQGKAIESISGWEGEGNGTDDYGFCALPGGQRGYMNWDTGQVLYYGSFIGKGSTAVWWTSTYMAIDAAANIRLVHNSNKIDFITGMNQNGFSVRCVRDLPAGGKE